MIAHVDKGRFARICGIVRLSLAALFLIPFTPVYLLPVFYVLQTSRTRYLLQLNTQFFKMLSILRCAVH